MVPLLSLCLAAPFPELLAQRVAMLNSGNREWILAAIGEAGS